MEQEPFSIFIKFFRIFWLFHVFFFVMVCVRIYMFVDTRSLGCFIILEHIYTLYHKRPLQTVKRQYIGVKTKLNPWQMRIHGTIYVLYKYRVMYGYSFCSTTHKHSHHTRIIRYVYPHIYIKSATKINLPRMQYKQPYQPKRACSKTTHCHRACMGWMFSTNSSESQLSGKFRFCVCVRAIWKPPTSNMHLHSYSHMVRTSSNLDDVHGRMRNTSHKPFSECVHFEIWRFIFSIAQKLEQF